MKQAIQTGKAPKAIGPYSQAVKIGGTVYVSGQLGFDPASGALVEGFEAQARQALGNVQAVVEAAGLRMTEVVKATVFVKDLANFARFNEIYGEFFQPPYPAREVVQAARLPRDGEVEVSVIAAGDPA